MKPRGWHPILLGRLKLKRPLGPNDRLVLTVSVHNIIGQAGFIEDVRVRRSRKGQARGKIEVT